MLALKITTKQLAVTLLTAALPTLAQAAPPLHYGKPFGFWYGLFEEELVGHVAGFMCASSDGGRVCSEIVREDQWPPIVGMGAAICKPGGGASAFLTKNRVYAMSCDVTEDTWRLILNKLLETEGQPKIANEIFLSVATTALEWKSGNFFYSLFKTTGTDIRGLPTYKIRVRIGDTPIVKKPNADVFISPMPISPGARLGRPFG